MYCQRDFGMCFFGLGWRFGAHQMLQLFSFWSPGAQRLASSCFRITHAALFLPGHSYYRYEALSLDPKYYPKHHNYLLPKFVGTILKQNDYLSRDDLTLIWHLLFTNELTGCLVCLMHSSDSVVALNYSVIRLNWLMLYHLAFGLLISSCLVWQMHSITTQPHSEWLS